MPLGANKAAIMGVAGVSTGDVVLLSSQTASNSASIAFTSGITSTYGEYIFAFYNINPATDGQHFSFQGSIDSGSNYNVAITSSGFSAVNEEGDSGSMAYVTSLDLAQGTGYQRITENTGSAADESCVGILHLFNPSSTTYVKHWMSDFSVYNTSPAAAHQQCAGYFNSTSAIDAMSFKFESGNINAGTIKMWGVK